MSTYKHQTTTKKLMACLMALGWLTLAPGFANATLLVHYSFDGDTVAGSTVFNQGTSDPGEDDDGNFFGGTVITGDARPDPQGSFLRATLNSVQAGNSVTAGARFTVAGWYRGTDTVGRFVNYIRNFGQFGEIFTIAVNTAAFDGVVVQSGNDLRETALPVAEFADGEWHHLALTYDSITAEAQLYFDGQLRDTLAGVPNRSILNGGPGNAMLFFGGANAGAGILAGDYDDLRVYNRVLTDFDIAELAQLVPEPSTGLLLGFGLFGLVMKRGRGLRV